MSTVALYAALVKAGVPEHDARAAVVDLQHDQLKTDVALIKWSQALVIGLLVTLLVRTFF